MERAFQRVLHLSLIVTLLAPTVSGVAEAEARPPDAPSSPDVLPAPAVATGTPAGPTQTATLEPTALLTDIPILDPTGVLTDTAEPTATASPTSDVTPTATPSPSVTPTEIITATATPTGTVPPVPEEVFEISPIGGIITTTSGLLSLDFPAGAVSETVVVTYQRLDTSPSGDPIHQGMTLAFDLTALTLDDGEPVTQFAQPLTFTLALDQLGFTPGLVDGRTVWFGHYDVLTAQWIKIPFSLDQTSGPGVTAQAAVNHFSTFGVGGEANPGWKLTFNEPNVSLFSGAGVFNYPLSLPPGRNGVGPSLSLSYNSRGVDHNRSWSQSDWVGHGWSLDTMEIVRRTGPDTTQDVTDCTGDFSLNFNGATYRLAPATPGAVSGRYYTQEDSGLYVERLTDGGAPNYVDQYWNVRDPSGTVYRFGWNADSEQIAPSDCTNAEESEGGKAVFRWRLDKVIDLSGNEMKLTYSEEGRTACPGSGNPGGDRASYLEHIYYNNTNKPATNWYVQVDLNRGTRPTAQDTDDGFAACDKLFFQAAYLDNVRVIVNGSLVRKFQFAYQLFLDNERNGQNFVTWKGALSRELSSVTEYAYDSLGNESVLPATSFTYIALGNSDTADCLPGVDCGDGPGNCPGGWCGYPVNNGDWVPGPGHGTYHCRWNGTYTQWQGGGGSPGIPYDCINFNYWRVSEVRNGYGAKTTFSYGNDGRSTYWLGGYAYRVDTRTVSASETGAAATYQYTYGTPCYNNNQPTDPLPPGGVQCKLPAPALADGQLMGYAAVTVTVKGYDNATLSITNHSFKTNENSTRLLGREYKTEYKDAAGALLRTSEQSYGVADSAADRWGTYLDHAYDRTYYGSSTKGTRTSYASDSYGNPTAQLEYGAEEPVVNPGFEGGSTSWTYFWSPTPASVVTGTAFVGRYALKLTGGTTGGAYQDITGLTSGVTYTVRAWITATTGTTGKFQLWLHDTTGANSYTSSPTTPVGYGWVPVTLDYPANSTGQVRVHLYYQQSGAGTIYVDEVAVARKSDVGDERSTYHLYNLNTASSVWIVNRVARDLVYDGIRYNAGFASAYLDAYTRYRYDSGCVTTPPTLGRLTSVDRWNGLVVSGGLCNPEAGYVTVNTGYNGWGNVIAQSTPFTGTTATIYTTTTTYDASFNLYPYTVTVPTGLGPSLTTTSTYDLRLGVPLTVTDPNNAATGYRYNSFGWLLKVLRPFDTVQYPTLEYQYYAGYVSGSFSGLRVLAIYREKSGCSGCNRPVYQFYDGLGRLVQTRAETVDGAQQAVTNLAYDARGLTISATVPLTETYDDDYVVFTAWATSPKTTSAYDALGRTTIITATDGTKTIHSYTLDTNTTSGYTPTGLWLHAVVDPNNHARQEVTDGRGRTIIVRELTGMNPWNLYAATRYQYNTLDLLTRVTDTVTNTTVITYNELGLKTAMSDPDMGTWKYGYDAAGNIITQTNALNQTLWFKYDALNRLKEKRDGSPTGAYLAQYGYDGYNGSTQFGRGQRTAMTDTVGTALWSFDQRGRVLTETRTITTPLNTFVTGYRYDALDRVITTTYPTGEVVTHTYNAQGLLENVRSQTQAVWYASNLDYDVAGRLELLALGNTLQTDYVYHPWTAVNGQGRLKQLKVGTGGAPTSVQDWQYGYDAVGNVKTITNTTLSETHNYSYDYLDRLVSGVKSTGAGYTSYYTYTVLGNLQNKTENGVTVTYTYPAAGQARPHAVTSLSNGNSYTYDANGNMTQRTESSIAYTQDWNKVGLLTGVTNTTASPFIITRYDYDGDGARVKKTEQVGLAVTTTLYASSIEVQIAGTTRITSSYYFAGAQLVAMREMTNTGGVTNTLYFLHTDHLGSNSITTNASGVVLARQSYMPYGSVRSGGTGVMPTDIGYTGQRLDAGTGGLMYYRARYYLPGLGRFASADTVVPSPRDPQAFNRYLYAGGNPLKYVDPSGHDWIDTLGQFASGVLFQWSVSNREAVIPSSPDQRQAVEALAADTDAFVAGRLVGGLVAAGQGLAEFSSGAGAIGGGLAACGSGVLCPAGAGAVAGGAIVAAHGVSVVIQGAAAAGQQLGILLAKSEQPSASSSEPTERHHLLPKQFRDSFEQAGLDIEDYTKDLPRDFHKDIHGRGGGEAWINSWNRQWARFFDQNRNPSADEILWQLETMKEEFGIP